MFEYFISTAIAEFLESPVATISGGVAIMAAIFAATKKGREFFTSTIEQLMVSQKRATSLAAIIHRCS